MPLRAILSVAAVTAAFGAALLLAPGAASTWAHAYLVAVTAGVLAAAVRACSRASRRQGPSVFDPALRRAQPAATTPEDLARLERLVTLGGSSAFDLHYRLRPAVREIAAGVLLRRGVELDDQPAQARALLGEQAWSLVRPDREPPHDRQGRGIEPAQLEAVLQGLEACR